VIEEKALVSINNLKKHFKIGRNQVLKAVDGVSFDINKGETLGLVGESGCGKSTLGRTIIGLYKATSGEIIFNGTSINQLNKAERKNFTKQAQMIFQDPYASLNPRMTVTDIIAEGIDIHNLSKGMERQNRIYKLLELVGLSREHANRLPHEFSGGQRQRIGLARALAIEPKFIICDEPISALDVSVKAQIINLLQDIQKELGLTYLFIAHDLSMINYMSDRVAVMYLGSIVELSGSKNIFSRPLHPYTSGLMSAIPIPDPEISKMKKRSFLSGEIPSPINMTKGCKFEERCDFCQEICRIEEPKLREIRSGHLVACHLVKVQK
jgi:oligopeptide transport system ATP-binding protein